MKLHLGDLGDHAQTTIAVEHVNPPGVLTIEDLIKKKEHTQAMLEIASALSYVEFDDIKGYERAKKIWDNLHTIYGGDANFLRVKSKSLRGKFDDMRMQEGENISQYYSRIKDVINEIRGATGKIDDETILRKLLRTFLPIYVIKISTIQELRCITSSNLTIEGFVGRLTTFELSNFDNVRPKNVEFSFKTKLSLKESKEKTKRVKICF